MPDGIANPAESACLLIADISGYTGYLAAERVAGSANWG
jgi:hypothetical protein